MEWEALAARVTRLEKLNRRLLLGCAALLVLCAGLGAAAVSDIEFGTVKARQVQIVDASGNVLGVFGANVTGDNSSLTCGALAAGEFTLPGPDNRPYARITTIPVGTSGKKAGGFVLTDHAAKEQTILLAGREISIVDF